jgi:outer membrane immunogenic protein
LLGIGAEYAPFNGQSANYSYTAAGTTVNGTWKKQNSYNIFLSPATPVGADGLLYGKVGYTGTSIQATEVGTTNTDNLTGYSLGVGYKQIIRGGLYGFGEVNYASYSNKSSTYSGVIAGRAYSYTNTVKANATNVVVGVGYKF